MAICWYSAPYPANTYLFPVAVQSLSGWWPSYQTMSFFQCSLERLQSGRACCLLVPTVELSRTAARHLLQGLTQIGKKRGEVHLAPAKESGRCGKCCLSKPWVGKEAFSKGMGDTLCPSSPYPTAYASDTFPLIYQSQNFIKFTWVLIKYFTEITSTNLILSQTVINAVF